MDQKYGIIYLWRDRKHKRYYLGCHWGTEDDGYICSSRWMRNAYKRRSKDFRRRIIERSIVSKEEMFLREEKWLSLIKDNELKVKYYNIQKTWKHWAGSTKKSMSVKKKLSEAIKRLHHDPIYRKKFIEGRKNLPPRTKEAIEKTALANTGKKRTEETKRKISKALKGKKRGPLSDEHRKKVSESLKGEKNPFYGKQHDPEKKKQMNERTSKTMKGKMPKNMHILHQPWWNNGIKNTRSLEQPGSDWVRGMLR